MNPDPNQPLPIQDQPAQKLELPKAYPRAATVLSALADVTRGSILYLLGTRGSMNAGQIASHFDISRPAISHHLGILHASHLVDKKRAGRHIYYSFDTKALAKSLRKMADNMENWSPSDENPV